MHKLKTDQNGFSAFELLLVLIIFGLIGFIGWYVMNSKQDTDSTLTTASLQTNEAKKVDQPKLSETFTDTKDSVTFKYPSSWKIDIQKQDDFEQGALSGTLTSPDGTLVLGYSNFVAGVGGGSCPDAFPCPSVEIVNLTNLPKAKDNKIVEKITHWAGNGDGYTVSIGLASNEVLKGWSVGAKQTNDFYLFDDFAGKDGYFAYNFSPNSSPERGFKTEKEAKAFLAGENAKIAKRILQSVTVE